MIAGGLLMALLVILGAAEFFTNGVEWVAVKLNLSEGVTGSVLAAVGTALPETLIPIVAVCSGAAPSSHETRVIAQTVSVRHDVGIGAIAGAPFMLCTLTMAVCGTAVWLFSRRGKRSPELSIDNKLLSRDLSFFIGAYSFALLGVLARDVLLVRRIMSVMLVATYLFYLKQTFAHEGESGAVPERLHLDRLLKTGTALPAVVAQVLLGLAGIVGGAFVFVDNISLLSVKIGVPAWVLAMIIAPVATELPEKFNSVIWSRNGKDTLAIGNITGALVFQSCFPVAFGLAFTAWNPGGGAIVSGVVALCFASVYLILIKKRMLGFGHLMLGALGYVAVVSWLLVTHLLD